MAKTTRPFKSVLGTLLTCPGRGHCNNRLMCRDQFRQCRYPTSDDEAAVFTCRHQWKARRADIEVLARRAEAKTNRAKRIPVLADVTLLRSHRDSAATVSGHQKNTLSWSDWLVYTQLWMRIGQTGYPSWAQRILEYLGHALHHPAQLTLAEFAAFHLRDVIFNLDMLSVARTAKLTPPTQKLKAEDEGEREEAEKEAVLNSLRRSSRTWAVLVKTWTSKKRKCHDVPTDAWRSTNHEPPRVASPPSPWRRASLHHDAVTQRLGRERQERQAVERAWPRAPRGRREAPL